MEEEEDESDLEKEERDGGYCDESADCDLVDEVEADGDLVDGVKAGSGLADGMEAGSASFLIDFPAVANSVSSAVLGLEEEEFSKAWQGAATAALRPALLVIHR